MMALVRWLLGTRHHSEAEDLAEVRHRQTRDVRDAARRVQGAALDAQERSEATVRAIDDMLRRMR